MAKNVLLEKTLDFALAIIDFTEQLKKLHQYELASQLFRSGTSIGANTNEAQQAESRADFIHKLKIAAKEAQETNYWLTLCKLSKHYPNNPDLLMELEEIQKLLNKIIGTARKNNKR